MLEHAGVVGLGDLGDRRPGGSVGVRDRDVRGEDAVPATGEAQPRSISLGSVVRAARSERTVWLGAGHPTRLDLDPEGGKIAIDWTLTDTGPAVAPPQIAAGLLVLTQQSNEGPGVLLWGIEPESGNVRWRTLLGTSWRIAPEPGRLDASVLETLAADGRVVTLRPDRLATGGFVTLALPGPGDQRLPTGTLRRVEADDLGVLVAPSGTNPSSLLVRDSTSPDGTYRRVELPGPVGASPIVWNDGLLVPGGRTG